MHYDQTDETLRFGFGRESGVIKFDLAVLKASYEVLPSRDLCP